MAFVVKVSVVLLLLYVLLLVATPYLQRRLIYFPETARITPASVDLAAVEEVVLRTPDGKNVIAWWGRAKPGQFTILYFHGNAGSFGVRAERIRKYLARGYGMFMMTYRGFGGGTGAPSEKANVADGKLAYDTLVAKGVDPASIIVYGESLGTGVAVQVAAEKRVAGIILDAPYTSIVDLAQLHYPYLPARWVMTDRYESLGAVGKLTAPLLVLHGEEDDIIPLAMGRMIYRAAHAPKEIATFPGAGHSDHYMFGSYDVIWGWLERLAQGRQRRVAG